MRIIEFPQKTCAAKPSFESVYEECYQPLLHYLYKKTGRMQDAEDLTSETFLYCYRSYDSYDPAKSKASTWVYLVANSRLKNYYRDKREHVEISELENLLPAEETDMERAAWLEQLRGFLGRRICPQHLRRRIAGDNLEGKEGQQGNNQQCNNESEQFLSKLFHLPPPFLLYSQ